MSNIEKKYQKLTQREHVLKRPGMYIGAVENIDETIWILEDNNIRKKSINYSPGLYKIFDEILVNAYDETTRDKQVSLIKVDINPDKNEVTVFNDGKGIDVIIHPKEGIYVPELIFSHLLTSTTFADEKKRITGGIHGLGAKLTAIFSTYFKVEVGDPVNKKKFTQVYKNNLSKKSTPVIENYEKDTGFVKITYKPDLRYFKVDKLDKDMVSLMSRRVYDIAALTPKHIKVYLNKEKVPVNNFMDYVTLFTSDRPKIIELCDPKDETYVKNRWKIIIAESVDDRFEQISFVNGIYTLHGGRHVEYIVGKIVKGIKHIVEKKYKGANIKESFIKDRFWIFISSVIENPTFSSQTKEELVTPVKNFGSTCQLSKGLIKKMFSQFELDKEIQNWIKIKEIKELGKTDVKKRSQVKGIKKLYDANFAGTSKSRDCTLILTEGDSAKAMAISGLAAIPKANDYYGVFPLKGKLLNVREATHSQIINNEEFKNLKRIIGIQTGKKYTLENISELRYGKILLMMDADVDGSHIKGLFINMIDYYWPSLLKIDGFIQVLITPVVKVSRKNETISFYTLTDYENWKKGKDTKKWTIKYYKGLGTNTAQEAREYFKNLDKHTVGLKLIDERGKKAIKLAFAKKEADNRKLWLKKYDRDIIVDQSKDTLSYYDFIHKELIHFSNYDNIRSIPSLVDGFKPSQRKVLYAGFKRDLKTEIKVAQFVGYISEHTSYHHGENSLVKTVIGMSQNFVGANNINLFVPKGQFGTRLLGGKDHSSARYIFTLLEDITRKIFHKDDDRLLNYLDDDGFRIEPEYYIPVIPMILVNGADGIGTGYSTDIPKYNPKNIIENIRSKLEGNKFKKMKPWYQGFTGEVIDIGDGIYLSKGSYKKLKGKYLQITELPIGVWTENYKIFLEDLIMKKKYIKSIKNNSTESVVDFVIKFREDGIIDKLEKIVEGNMNGLEKLLKLTRRVSTNNMHLYDKEGIIKKYASPLKILEEFYELRLEYYQRRKDMLLKKLKAELKILDSKVKFVRLVVGKKIDLVNKSRDKMVSILEKHKLLKLPDEQPFDYLIRMSFYSLSQEKIKELENKFKEKSGLFNALKKKEIKDMWLEDLDNIKIDSLNL